MDRDGLLARVIADLCEIMFWILVPCLIFVGMRQRQTEQIREVIDATVAQLSQIVTANPESVGGSKGPVVWPVRADVCPTAREQGDPEELGSSKGFN